MSQKAKDLMFALLRSAVCGKKLSAAEKGLCSEAVLKEIFDLSQRHNIVHLIGYGMQQNGLLNEKSSVCENFRKAEILAAYRFEQMNYELSQISDTLEEERIPFLPLKGAVMSRFYPEEWMRVGGDLDILVQRKNLEQAVSVLCEKCGYEETGFGSHDVGLKTPGQFHIELHYKLLESGYHDCTEKLLDSVWAYSFPVLSDHYCYEMEPEMFYFYHIAHMAKHFENGGCGIRPILDLWILNSRMAMDRKKKAQILQKGNLDKFAANMDRISKIWMEQENSDRLMKKTEEYLLRGDAYGSVENRVQVSQVKKGGKAEYLLSRIFLPASQLQYLYPNLKKYPGLLPMYEVKRWFRLFSSGRLKPSLEEYELVRSSDRNTLHEMQRFMEDIGL